MDHGIPGFEGNRAVDGKRGWQWWGIPGRSHTAKGQIVELRFFGGLSLEEAAEAQGIPVATVEREWRAARAWLHREIVPGHKDGS